MPSRPASFVLLAVALSLAGCAVAPRGATAAAMRAPAAERIEMEPMALAAVGRGAERRVEAWDAGGLFEQAGADLAAERWAEAAAGYDRLVATFPDSRYEVAALYNAGLALEGLRDWVGAAQRYRTLVEAHGETRDALDALYRMGACLAESGNWPASAEAFGRLAVRKELGVGERIEALARRGLGQYQTRDATGAERTFREALALYLENEPLERIDRDFYVAMCRFYLAELAHDSFRTLPVRLPERQMRQDLEIKAKQLLVAQARYVDVARIRHPAWATAAGHQMAMLYRELFDSLMEAPVPPRLSAEAQQVYREELRKMIAPLLRKAIHAHELTRQVAERNGVDNDWVRRSNEQVDQLRALLPPGTDQEVPAPEPAPPLVPSRPNPALEKMQPPPFPRRDLPSPRILF